MKKEEDQRLLTIRQAARALQVHPNTVYRWVYAGKLNHVRLGNRTMRITADAIDQFVQDGRK